MEKKPRELLYTAVRYVFGIATGSELSESASKALDQGIYSPSLVELTTANNPFEQKSLFESTMRELGLDMPEKAHCVFMMLRYHLETIADGSVPPKKGLENMMREVFYPADIHNQTPKGGFVGCSHGIERLVGLYWEYDELHEREIALDKKSIDKVYAELNKETLEQSRAWLEKHLTKF